ncbi:MAG TPA: hypothetical protein VIP46_20830 [Pyrinomonadaceae bacterium]
MIAPSLYAYLRSRGVRLSLAGDRRLRVLSPAGALCAELRRFVRAHAEELAQFVYELEERAAVFEHEYGLTKAEAELSARQCVRGGTAAPDGQLWLREFAATLAPVRDVLDIFGGEIVEVRLAG